MLNKIEKKILKYLVENYPNQEIPQFKGVDLQEIFDALDSLDRKRYIIDLSTFCLPQARLTYEDKSFFENNKD